MITEANNLYTMVKPYQKSIIWTITVRNIIQESTARTQDKSAYLLTSPIYKMYDENGYILRIHNELIDLSKINKKIKLYYSNDVKDANWRKLGADIDFMNVLLKYFRMFSKNEMQSLLNRAKRAGYTIDSSGNLIEP